MAVSQLFRAVEVASRRDTPIEVQSKFIIILKSQNLKTREIIRTACAAGIGIWSDGPGSVGLVGIDQARGLLKSHTDRTSPPFCIHLGTYTLNVVQSRFGEFYVDRLDIC